MTDEMNVFALKKYTVHTLTGLCGHHSAHQRIFFSDNQPLERPVFRYESGAAQVQREKKKKTELDGVNTRRTGEGRGCRWIGRQLKLPLFPPSLF